MKLRAIHAATLFLFLIMLAASTKAAFEPTCDSKSICAYTGYFPPSEEVEKKTSNFACGTKQIGNYGVSWSEVISKAVQKYPKVKEHLMYAVLQRESGGKYWLVGLDGECGAFQIMEINWGSGAYGKYSRVYIKGMENQENSCFNPQVNANNAARILDENLVKYCNGDTWCALKTYNGGPKSKDPRAIRYANEVFASLKKYEPCYT